MGVWTEKKEDTDHTKGRRRVINRAVGVEWTGPKKRMAGLALNRGKKLRMDMNFY